MTPGIIPGVLLYTGRCNILLLRIKDYGKEKKKDEKAA